MGKRPITRDFGQEELLALFYYDPESGLFTRKVDRAQYKAGSIAGGAKDGYIIISVNSAQYRAHHLAWVYMTGEWPPEGVDIDHIDRDRSNNRWSNLRLVTRTQNNMNGSVRADNKSGFRGVGLRKDTGKWYARIKANDKLHLLGHFDTIEEAVEARAAAEKEVFGEFSPSA